MEKLLSTGKGLTFNISGLFLESVENGYGSGRFCRATTRTTSGVTLEISAYEDISKYFQEMFSYPNPPHKHAEVIKAWADGAEIESIAPWLGEWVDCPNPLWRDTVSYRIKPSKSDKDIEIENIQKEMEKLNARLGKLKESK